MQHWLVPTSGTSGGKYGAGEETGVGPSICREHLPCPATTSSAVV